MPDQISSILLGTAGLSAAALAALALACTRAISAPAVPAVMGWTLVGVLVHACHFVEETFTGFHREFPGLLGLSPWPLEFFVTFNLTWMAIWLACVPALRRWPRLAGFPVWFLAIASTANGIVHPLLAAAVASYFPGLWTSPLAGLAGIGLLRQLLRRAQESTTTGRQNPRGRATRGR